MRSVACDVCHSRSIRSRFELHDTLLNLAGVFTLVQCNSCGFFYLNPQPEWSELVKYYSADYFPHRVKPSGGLVGPILRTSWQRRVNLVKGYVHSGRLLDVGCGSGQFLAAIQAAGDWECQGVEPIEAAAAAARQVSQAPVFCGMLEEAHFAPDFFDVVTLWDVLEHVAHPYRQLQEISRILKPGGLAFIRTPNPDSFMAHLFGRYWANYDAPRHLGLFPRPLLNKKMEDLDFSRPRVRFLGSEYFTVFASLAVWATETGRPRLAAAFQRVVRSTALRVLTAPLFYLPGLFGAGSSPVYVGRKGGHRP